MAAVVELAEPPCPGFLVLGVHDCEDYPRGAAPDTSTWSVEPLLEAQHRHREHDGEEYRQLAELRPHLRQRRTTQHHAADDDVEVGQREDLCDPLRRLG